MAENRSKERVQGGAAVLGYVAAAVAAVCIILLFVHKMNNVPWSKKDTVAVVVACLGVAGCLAVWWREVSGVFGNRGAMLNLNAGVTAVLVLGILVIVNYTIIPRHLGFIKKDLTAEKFYSLAPQTVNLLKGLPKDKAIEIIGIVPMDAYARQAAHTLEVNKKRLEEYERMSKHVKVEILDPNISNKAMELLKQRVLSAVPGAVVRLQAKPEVREAVTSLDEAEITKTIMKLLDTSSRKVYVLSGHGEVGLTGDGQDQGLTALKQALENDRYEVADLKLLGPTKIPTDAAGLIIAAPKQPFLPVEIETLKAYVKANGRVLAFLDPDGKSNLGEVLATVGIEWKPEVVADQQATAMGDPQMFAAFDAGTNEAVNVIKKYRGFALMTRSGHFKQGTPPPDVEVSEALKTTATAKAGTATGPFAVIMTAATKEAKPEELADKEKDKAKADDKDKAKAEEAKQRLRVAVVGCADFASGPFAKQTLNVELAANMVAWMTDNTKAIGIRAKNPFDDEQKRKITVDAKKRKWAVLFTLWLPLFVVGLAGVAVHVVRTRR
jgi:ABC-type uncharacterized transport system involved in gliding motility auxiliary subunit